MPKTQQRSSANVESSILKALSHPLRQRILQELESSGVLSPNQLSQALDEPLGNVSYHVKMLKEWNCVELVSTRPRRGAVEHFYRAIARPWLDDDQWASLPLSLRRQTLRRTVGDLFSDAAAAAQEGGFDHPQVHVSRMLLSLDEAGWQEMVTILGDVLESANRIQAESAARAAEQGADAPELNSELGILHFLTPVPAAKKRGKARRRSGE